MAEMDHNMGDKRSSFVEIIRFYEANEMNYRILCKEGPHIIPFVGAGVSAAFGCGSWDDLLRKITDIAKLRLSEREMKEIQKKLDRKDYLSAADIILNSLTDQGREIMYWNKVRQALKTYEKSEITVTDEDTAYWIPELGKGYCITTNFDRVLEKTAEKRGKPYDNIYDHRNFRASNGDKRILYKIHGDIQTRLDEVDPDNPLLLLAGKHYDIVYGKEDDDKLPTPLVASLSSWADEYIFLFIGSSLSEQVIARAIERFVKKEKIHYALLAEGSEERIRKQLGNFHFVQEILYPRSPSDKKHSSLALLLHQYRRDTISLIWNLGQNWEEEEVQHRKEITDELRSMDGVSDFFSDQPDYQRLSYTLSYQDKLYNAANDYFVWPKWMICRLNIDFLDCCDIQLEEYSDYLPLGNTLYLLEYSFGTYGSNDIPTKCEMVCEKLKEWHEKYAAQFTSGIGIRIMCCGCSDEESEKRLNDLEERLNKIYPREKEQLDIVYRTTKHMLSILVLWNAAVKAFLEEERKRDAWEYFSANIAEKIKNHRMVRSEAMTAFLEYIRSNSKTTSEENDMERIRSRTSYKDDV